ncbi:nuclear transport factor 2 family protein [Actinomycetospora soli]|uniref:nuclear transport factor 2 family protein n=1 Tax=Actinomycetospora soli TaxID=2893887 RepID=UPI001E2F25B2|nr:nuclear transport factor 2 family protein [Actinomycetospora soli]MCD2186713.1 nuclear transport factor 2 family protein [Actinomycetospora soli]
MDDELRAVIDLELRLLDLEVRRSRELAGPLIDPEFREFGASGREWDRESVLAVVFAADHEPLVVSDEAAVRLAEDVVLVTYRTRRRERTTLRSSIWRREPGGPWRVLFHQGTPVPTQM